MKLYLALENPVLLLPRRAGIFDGRDMSNWLCLEITPNGVPKVLSELRAAQALAPREVK